jgi:tRNA modification GTPase
MDSGKQDTITAIATATGPGAVGIIRLSGADALEIARRCFAGLPPQPRSHQLYLGRVIEPRGGEPLDEALAVWMGGPRTFTGEDVVEVQCHGGELNMRRVLDATLGAGARLARPGEFSLRAFLNGRLDLTQAEAIAAVIAAADEEALRVAQAQLGGALRRPIERLRQDIMDLLTLVEAAIDFAGEEHVYQLDLEETAGRLAQAVERVQRMARTYQSSRAHLGGGRVVLIGAPNVGKSSLFNALVGSDRAIVTDVAGTTRDTLEEAARLGGKRVHLIDTAGLRADAPDLVERIGVERSLAQAKAADVVCWVLEVRASGDGGSDDAPSAPPAAVIEAASRDALICVLNKADNAPDEAPPTRAAVSRHQRRALAAAAPIPDALRGANVITASAHTGEGISALEAEVAACLSRLAGRSQEGDAPMITSARHVEALREAAEALSRAQGAAEAALPLELIAADIREGADALGAIVGAISSEDVLNNIFSSFCVGK